MKSGNKILLVEDDLVDAMTVKRALKEINVTNALEITTNSSSEVESLTSYNMSRDCALVWSFKSVVKIGTAPGLNCFEIILLRNGSWLSLFSEPRIFTWLTTRF